MLGDGLCDVAKWRWRKVTLLVFCQFKNAIGFPCPCVTHTHTVHEANEGNAKKTAVSNSFVSDDNDCAWLHVGQSLMSVASGHLLSSSCSLIFCTASAPAQSINCSVCLMLGRFYHLECWINVQLADPGAAWVWNCLDSTACFCAQFPTAPRDSCCADGTCNEATWAATACTWGVQFISYFTFSLGNRGPQNFRLQVENKDMSKKVVQLLIGLPCLRHTFVQFF